MRPISFALLLAMMAASTTAACYDNVSTEFPAGLEPLEENAAPTQTGATYSETLALVEGDDDYMWVHGRGYVNAPAARVWAALKNPETMVGGCAVDSYSITPDVEPAYEFSFEAHYVRNEIITVEWQNNFRYGTIEGVAETPEFALIRYQKTFGNEVISLIEGSVQLHQLSADVTELQYIEHLSAIRATTGDMKASMKQRFAKALAEAHDEPLSVCP